MIGTFKEKGDGNGTRSMVTGRGSLKEKKGARFTRN